MGGLLQLCVSQRLRVSQRWWVLPRCVSEERRLSSRTFGWPWRRLNHLCVSAFDAAEAEPSEGSVGGSNRLRKVCARLPSEPKRSELVGYTLEGNDSALIRATRRLGPRRLVEIELGHRHTVEPACADEFCWERQLWSGVESALVESMRSQHAHQQRIRTLCRQRHPDGRPGRHPQNQRLALKSSFSLLRFRPELCGPTMLSAAATTLTSAALAPKSVVKVLPKSRAHWVGDGFHVHPILGSLAFSGAVSPFLLLDYAAPKHFPPTAKRLGVGQHPHRGFETVTIAFQGQVEHADSLGNTDTIGVGDVQAKTHTDFSPLVVTPHCSHRSRHLVRVQHAQWMTAGRGIIHEEFHARSFAKQGGTFEMVQLWASLPPHCTDPAHVSHPMLPICHAPSCVHLGQPSRRAQDDCAALPADPRRQHTDCQHTDHPREQSGWGRWGRGKKRGPRREGCV